MKPADYEREIHVAPQEQRCADCDGAFSDHEVTDLFGRIRCHCKPEWMGGCQCREFRAKEGK